MNNITIAVLDTGVYLHRDFYKKGNKIIGFADMIRGYGSPYDDNGHGTHVCGLLVSEAVNEKGKRIGVAPDSRIVMIKVLDARGNGKVSTMLRGMDWILSHYQEYNIRIVNISVGMVRDKRENPEKDILVQKVEELWDAGLIVIVAAGNQGPEEYTITSPGTSRKVITVGAMSGNIQKKYSGKGPVPQSCVCKPDLVAPAEDILSCDNRLDAYRKRSGTSMATPIVSGAVALLLQKEPQLSNLEVKLRLLESCIDLGEDRNYQGRGMLSLEKLSQS